MCPIIGMETVMPLNLINSDILIKCFKHKIKGKIKRLHISCLPPVLVFKQPIHWIPIKWGFASKYNYVDDFSVKALNINEFITMFWDFFTSEHRITLLFCTREHVSMWTSTAKRVLYINKQFSFFWNKVDLQFCQSKSMKFIIHRMKNESIAIYVVQIK